MSLKSLILGGPWKAAIENVAKRPATAPTGPAPTGAERPPAETLPPSTSAKAEIDAMLHQKPAPKPAVDPFTARFRQAPYVFVLEKWGHQTITNRPVVITRKFLAHLLDSQKRTIGTDAQRAEYASLCVQIQRLRDEIMKTTDDAARKYYRAQSGQILAAIETRTTLDEPKDHFTREEIARDFQSRRKVLKQAKREVNARGAAIRADVIKELIEIAKDHTITCDDRERSMAESLGADFLPSGELISALTVAVTFAQSLNSQWEPTFSDPFATLLGITPPTQNS